MTVDDDAQEIDVPDDTAADERNKQRSLQSKAMNSMTDLVRPQPGGRATYQHLVNKSVVMHGKLVTSYPIGTREAAR